MFENRIFAEVSKIKIERRQVSLWELRQPWRLGAEGSGKTGRARSDRSVSPGSPPELPEKEHSPLDTGVRTSAQNCERIDFPGL